MVKNKIRFRKGNGNGEEEEDGVEWIEAGDRGGTEEGIELIEKADDDVRGK